MKTAIVFLMVLIPSVLLSQTIFKIDFDNKNQYYDWEPRQYPDELFYVKSYIGGFESGAYSQEKDCLQLVKLLPSDDFYYGCLVDIEMKLGDPIKNDNYYNGDASQYKLSISTEVLMGYRTYAMYWDTADKYFGLLWKGNALTVIIKYK